ncbi:hypothetical protein LY78DRAFT_687106 [Colletotrichum sublineola]|nr:hypothetical protein LY78DRAFT_687106 [Colletotrichum sublineola]
MDPLRQPTETESKWYYYGLPSRPKLVARSSFTPYVLPMEGRLPEPKTQTVVGEHDIVAKWNNDPSMLQEQIFNILTQHDVQWQAIDILRIGYSNQEEIPVILSISVSREVA